LIDEAEKLNQESANTLLKTMEEPGQEIYQILLTSQIGSLLKTFVSRAQALHFKPIDRKKIKQDLLIIGVVPRLASAISELTFNTDNAIRLSQDENTAKTVDLALDIYHHLQKKDQSVILLFKDNRNLVLETTETADFFLGIMIIILKDILNYKLRYLDLIVFDSETSMIEHLAETTTQRIIEEQLDLMLGLKAKLKYNINSSLAFDKMLTCLERGIANGLSCSIGPV
jgi:DNA polymerase-3 subunit delta'